MTQVAALTDFARGEGQFGPTIGLKIASTGAA
jgi:hypothetical protein